MDPLIGVFNEDLSSPPLLVTESRSLGNRWNFLMFKKITSFDNINTPRSSYVFICSKVKKCGGRENFMDTLCKEYYTVLLFANSTNIEYLILSAKLTKTADVRNEVIAMELRITLLLLENVNASQHLNSYLKAVYFVREI